MQSRTAAGKYTKRYIVLKKSKGNGDTTFVRSVNVPGFYPTKELAQAAVEEFGSKLPTTQYRIRQK